MNKQEKKTAEEVEAAEEAKEAEEDRDAKEDPKSRLLAASGGSSKGVMINVPAPWHDAAGPGLWARLGCSRIVRISDRIWHVPAPEHSEVEDHAATPVFLRLTAVSWEEFAH